MNYLRSEMSLPVATIRMRSVQMVFLAFVTVSFLCTKHSLAMADGVCPEQIAQTCECFPSMQLVRCVNKDLAQYPELKTIQHIIKHLDVSSNHLKTLPKNIERFMALEVLDISHNDIEIISSDIRLPVNLRILILAHNNISHWIHLSPNTMLRSAIHLHTLNLAGNPLKSFDGANDRLSLVSNSLKVLNVSYCQITKISSPLALVGLPHLEYLALSDNPISNIPDLVANRLFAFDLSHCKIGMTQRTIFAQMPKLEYINLSRNHRLSLEQNVDGGDVNGGGANSSAFVESISVRRIDLSYCNMNTVELIGFPNVTEVNLRNNLIVQLTESTFAGNKLIEELDLSYNSINSISGETFRDLKRLKTIDLSFNMIQTFDEKTFVANKRLMLINFSRNFIERLPRLESDTITHLNFSWCEIRSIAPDAFGALYDLIEIDLSNNLIGEFRGNDGKSLAAEELQSLDLSRCRLSTVRDDSFSSFPELKRLNLAGNRFTTTFYRSVFTGNPYLNDIWLGDNPWRCDCLLNGMHDFYRYLFAHPQRIKDIGLLRCTSPEHVFGELWESACRDDWNPEVEKSHMVERLWTLMILVLFIFSLSIYVVRVVKNCRHRQREARVERQRQLNAELTQELLQNNIRVLQQEALLNAPDPRETHPPCYEDAIQLPQMDTSFASLKRAGLISDEIGLREDALKRAMKRSRCRSEETLSVRDSDLRNPIANRTRRHIRASRIRRETKCAQSTLEIPSFSKIDSEKVFEFGSMDRFASKEGSPYAKRKATPTENQMEIPVASTSAVLLNEPRPNEIVIIENHYASKLNLRQPNSEVIEVAADVKITPPSSLSSTSTSPTNSSQSSRRNSSSSASDGSLDVAEYSSFSNDELNNVKETNI